ncbi:hypothetical protein [Streptomyces sp. MST-110588]|uniref:hypothetical protein n=1 Tax=Streptomyces sp. MST-110588 TaxID=2833628 RepID=UPI001F5DD962|nr:hypothetical protein [Streptomyces sp. MST-110588]UNO40245.1 hypothetical protein KGS77_12475 [Streptomyces sp. MST-110588]
MPGALHPEILDAISAAGFNFIEVVGTRDDLTPVGVALYVTQLYEQDGRHDVMISHDEPDLHSRINTEWERVAHECGLFSVAGDGRPEFLIGIDTSMNPSDEAEFRSYRWARVSLCENWDIAGSGCESGLLGAGPNNPTFAMMSVQGDVVMVAGYWQIGIGFSIVSHPEQIVKLQEHAKRIASYEHIETAQRNWAERWVTRLSL